MSKAILSTLASDPGGALLLRGGGRRRLSRPFAATPSPPKGGITSAAAFLLPAGRGLQIGGAVADHAISVVGGGVA